jgi:tetratricopeptide (TPR) repeat protein
MALKALLRKFARSGSDVESFQRGLAVARGRDQSRVNSTAGLADRIELLNDEGKLVEALRLAKTATVADPGVLMAKGMALYRWSRHREALQAMSEAEQLGASGPLFDIRMGWILLSLGLYDEGELRMRRVVEARPNELEGHFGLATALQYKKATVAAICSYERALSIDPTHKQALINLGVCRLDSGNFELAVDSFKRACEAHPESTIAHCNLGLALAKCDDAAAESAFLRAMNIERAGGENNDAFFNYANYLQNTGRLREAVDLYRSNIPSKPYISSGQLGMALMAMGQFKEGWNLYESRWTTDSLIALRVNVDVPPWSGQDLAGKTILLRCEQGIGDVIQFIRYAPLVKALGARTILQLREGTRELAAGFRGIDKVFEVGEEISGFDYYVHLMSLPRLFATTVDSVPSNVPYIDVVPSRAEKLQDLIRTNGRLKVGIVWAGSPSHLRDKYRSLRFEQVCQLFAQKDVDFYCLQKGPALEQANGYADQYGNFIRLDHHLGDFADTAAAVAQMDLVISVDTSVAHLAGALGVPTWIAVSEPAEWRWLSDRTDSPWYPTARIWRQRTPGDWSSLIAAIASELADVAPPKYPRKEINSPATRLPPPGFRPTVSPPGISVVSEVREGIMQFLPDDQDMGKSLQLYGEWQHRALAFLSRLIRVGQVMLEMGAAIGAHGIALSRMLGPTGHLYAYEDDYARRRLLVQNFSYNKVRNATILTIPSTSPTKSEFEREWDLDAIDLEPVDWIKFNDNKVWRAVLDASEDYIWRVRPRVVSFHEDDVAAQSAARTMDDYGYMSWMLTVPLFNPGNFNKNAVDGFLGRETVMLISVPESVMVDVDMSPATKA